MKTVLRNSLLAATAMLACQAAAQAAAITVTSTSPTWTYTGGTSTNTKTSGAGNSAVSQIFWGTNIGSGQSGLGFNPAQPPSITTTSGVLFNLGTLFHYNNTIKGDTPTSVTLNLATNIFGVSAAQTFAFGFQIDETPNVSPCPYPGTTPCSDKITFTNIDTSNAFTLNGQAYTMQLMGFSMDGGTTFSNAFISNENCINSAQLYAEFLASGIAVPEPATLAVIGAGLVGLTAIRRRSGASIG